MSKVSTFSDEISSVILCLYMPTGIGKGKDFPEVDQSTMQSPKKLRINNTESSSSLANSFQICDVTAPSSNTLSTFENFSIVINNLLDYELADNIQWSYYELCCSQNGLLHDHLPKWMNHILVQGIIIETVTIADALRQCELSTSKDTFVLWDKTLNALELLGMNIGFLRAHLDRLQKIVHDPEVATFRQKCLELCSENARSKDKIRCLKEKLAEMKIMHNKRGADIENLKAKVENHELKFQEQVHALW